MGGIGEYFWSKTEHIMGWDIKNDGFGVWFKPRAANLDARAPRRGAVSVSRREGLSLRTTSTVSYCTPGQQGARHRGGGTRTPRGQVRYSWDVLKRYGNMSSATALFVLKEALGDGARGRFLLAAFGPGFLRLFHRA